MTYETAFLVAADKGDEVPISLSLAGLTEVPEVIFHAGKHFTIVEGEPDPKFTSIMYHECDCDGRPHRKERS